MASQAHNAPSVGQDTAEAKESTCKLGSMQQIDSLRLTSIARYDDQVVFVRKLQSAPESSCTCSALNEAIERVRRCSFYCAHVLCPLKLTEHNGVLCVLHASADANEGHGVRTLKHVLKTRGSELHWRKRGLRIALQVTHATHQLHAYGTPHLHLSPESIFVRNDCSIALLSDAELSALGVNLMHANVEPAGTATLFIAPELFDDDYPTMPAEHDGTQAAITERPSLNERHDVFSLGVLLQCIVDGELVKMSTRGKLQQSGVPEDLHALVQECTHADQNQRPSLERLLRRLQPLCQEHCYKDWLYRADVDSCSIDSLLDCGQEQHTCLEEKIERTIDASTQMIQEDHAESEQEGDDQLPYGPPHFINRRGGKKNSGTKHRPKASGTQVRRYPAPPQTKEGREIGKGDVSYDLISQLQLGIEWSVSFAQRNAAEREVCGDDFSKGSPWRQRKMYFDSEGSRQTPKHSAPSFMWKDYYPVVFHKLREHFEIDPVSYLYSICGNQSLRDLGSPGKSGSVFFISADDKFIIKTMRKNEVRHLQSILPEYQAHVRSNPDTLLTKFYGLYRIKLNSGKKIRLVVMGNLLSSELRYHRKFDLKGSTFERSTPRGLSPERHILKDLDVSYTFRLESGTKDKLTRQLEADCFLLERMRIMDYSLLLGVHVRSASEGVNDDDAANASYEAITHHLQSTSEAGTISQSERSDVTIDTSSASSADYEETSSSMWEGFEATMQSYANGRVEEPQSELAADSELSLAKVAQVRPQQDDYWRPLPESEGSSASLARAAGRRYVLFGQNIAATAIPATNGIGGQGFGKRKDPILLLSNEGYTFAPEDVIISFGIIDILQEYSYAKWLEHGFRQGFRGQKNISAIDPPSYAKRFKSFLHQIFE